MSKKFDLAAMSVDEMWQLHEEIGKILSVRLTSEKRELEKRLAQLRRETESHRSSDVGDQAAQPEHRERRKYPRVFPKYRNPELPSQTWSGRGKQPRWFADALKTGRSIEEFLIEKPEADHARRRA